MNQDMDDVILKRLNDEFGCKKDIFKFSVNLNNHNWTASFDLQTTGAFSMKYFHLTNFSSIRGNIKSGAFIGSSHSLREVIFESGYETESQNRIEPDAFHNLYRLKERF